MRTDPETFGMTKSEAAALLDRRLERAEFLVLWQRDLNIRPQSETEADLLRDIAALKLAIKALQNADADIPRGFVLVPEHATTAMLDAGRRMHLAQPVIGAIYRAMIEASPRWPEAVS